MSLLVHDTPPSALVSAATRDVPATLSPAALLAYALSRHGLAIDVTLRGCPPAAAEFPGSPLRPSAALYLRDPLPLRVLPAILRAFLASPHAACLILAPPAANEEYREQLHIDGADRLVRVERHFHRAGSPPAKPDRIVGSIVRSPATRADTPRSAFALLRRGWAAGASFQIARSLEPPLPPATLEGHVLTSLSAEERAALADKLHFQRVADDCYASTTAQIAPSAFLRGPLFIDPDVQIADSDIHIGPAWLRPGSPPVTVAPHQTDLAAAASPPNPPTTPPPPRTSPHEYFVGPTLSRKPVYDLCKRTFDFTFSLFWLIVLSPILLSTALLIKLYDFGPIFFVHEREGLHGKPFGCVKFRSMVRNAEALKDTLKSKNLVDGPQFKIAHDPRITPIGRFIRKTNIDELPQLYNVLLGQMSIVGPRPSPFKENQLCPPWREARLSVKPGITGLWQVSRSHDRGAADFQEWIVYDTQYVERRSFFLDLKLILLTVKEILGKGQ